MRNVLVVGAHGPGDPGEAARLDAVIRAFGADRVIVTSPAPATTSEAFGCRAIAPTVPALAKTLRDADAVIVAGGTVFGHPRRYDAATWATSLGGLVAMAGLAAACQVPFALLGVGAGELRGPRARRLARHLVNHADLLILRDHESAAMLAAAGASTPFRVGADPAWSLVTAPPPPRIGGEAVLVAVSDVARPEAVSQLAVGLRDLVADGHTIHLQPWEARSEGAASRLAAAITDRLDGDVNLIDPTMGLADTVARMAGYRLVVSPRVGAVLAAAAAGAAVVAIAHEPGVAALARRLGQRSVPGHASAGVVARALMLGVEQRPVDPDLVEVEARRAREGYELAHLLLDQSRAHSLGDLDGLVLTSGSVS